MKYDNRSVEKPPYLYRRGDDKSSSIYFRLTAPKTLHEYLKPNERQFRVSTGTADLARARVIGAEIVSRKRREWDELLASLSTCDLKQC